MARGMARRTNARVGQSHEAGGDPRRHSELDLRRLHAVEFRDLLKARAWTACKTAYVSVDYGVPYCPTMECAR